MPETDTLQQPATTDPKSAGPKPDPQQEKIAHPGLTEDMRTKPDHGEESYQGLGRLKDRAAILRAPIAASDARLRSRSHGRAPTSFSHISLRRRTRTKPPCGLRKQGARPSRSPVICGTSSIVRR